MKEQLKKDIAIGVALYAKKNGLSNNDVAKAADVNSGYINNILRHIFTVEINGKPTEIGDTHFYKLAAFAGIAVKKEYWKLQYTIQFKEMISALEDAKKYPSALMIINDTGLGKSKAIDVFCKNVPQNTYRITVGDSYKLEDLITELCFKIGVEVAPLAKGRIQAYSLKLRLDKLADKLIEIKNAGGSPLIILDEAENLKPQVLKTIKEIYDAIISHCSIVLIGTDQILDSMLNRRNKNRQAIPQLYRRFKAGIREITPLNKARDYKIFFDNYNIDPSFQILIKERCDNYGELHDFLEPVLRYADENGKTFSEDLFRRYHKLFKAVKHLAK